MEKAPFARSSCSKACSRVRRKFVEPVSITLTSDGEEYADLSADDEEEYEDRGKSGQSQDENDAGCDDNPEFPGVIDILYKRTPVASESEEEEYEVRQRDKMEADEEEGMEEEKMVGEEELEESEIEEDEEEEVPPDEEHMKGPLENIPVRDLLLRCRSVRIGSFKVYPKPNAIILPVHLSMDGISFNAPMVSDSKKIINITLKFCDVTQMLVHFGKCLPVIFISTTTHFADAMRISLNMLNDIFGYYDPTSSDEKQKRITFLIDNLNKFEYEILKTRFLTDTKVREIDQKTANEILVKSTPNQGPKQSLTRPLQAKKKVVQVPVKGIEFMKPLNGFSCKLCSIYLENKSLAKEHLHSLTHVTNFRKFQETLNICNRAITSLEALAAPTSSTDLRENISEQIKICQDVTQQLSTG